MTPSPAPRPARPSSPKDRDTEYRDYVVSGVDTFFGMFSNRPEFYLGPLGFPRPELPALDQWWASSTLARHRDHILPNTAC